MKDKQCLEIYLNKGEFPFDYERQLLHGSSGFIGRVLAGEIMPPLHFEILPTDACNNLCIWCKGGHRARMTSKNEIREDAMLRLMSELKDYGISGVVRFSGMVGEPLMHEGTLKAIRKGSDLGLNIGLITNGILLTAGAYDSLRGITYVSVSLDAGRQETFNRLKGHRDNTFGIIVDNIERLATFREQCGEKFRLTVGYVLHPDNLEEASEAAELVKSSGADIIQFKLPLGASFFGEGEIIRIEESLKMAKEQADGMFRVELMQGNEERRDELCGMKRKPDFQRCYSQFINGVVSSDGNVYPCVHYNYQNGVSSKPLGSIYEQSFREIWEGGKRIKAIGQINPSRDCGLCNRYDGRVNKFIDFINKS